MIASWTVEARSKELSQENSENQMITLFYFSKKSSLKIFKYK